MAFTLKSMAHIQTRSHWSAVYVAYLSRCVLKMDHHCPWYVQYIFIHQKKTCFALCLMLFDLFSFRVNNCVGFSNYKFFILFLTYASLYCLVICATVTQYFIKFWTVSAATSPFLPCKWSKYYYMYLKQIVNCTSVFRSCSIGLETWAWFV